MGDVGGPEVKNNGGYGNTRFRFDDAVVRYRHRVSRTEDVKRSYYRYEGSLSTPPCAETVNWFVLTESIQVAEADINSFTQLYPMNARPMQKDNRRFVLRSS